MAGDLPPSSRVTFFRLLPAAALAISFADLGGTGEGDFIDLIMWAARGAPQGSPKPVRMLTTPGGKAGFHEELGQS